MSSGFDHLERELVTAAARPERRRRSRRRAGGQLAGRVALSLNIIVVLAIAAGAVVLPHPAHPVLRPVRGAASALPPLLSYQDPAGWSFRYSTRFYLDQKRFWGTQTGPIVVVTVASFPLRGALVPNGASVRLNAPADPAGRFPANGVAFRLQEIPGASSQLAADSARPPISLSTFSQSVLSAEREEMIVHTYLDERPDGDTRTLIRGVMLGHGIVWAALAWIGPLAPPSLRLALEQTISSLADHGQAADSAPSHG